MPLRRNDEPTTRSTGLDGPGSNRDGAASDSGDGYSRRRVLRAGAILGTGGAGLLRSAATSGSAREVTTGDGVAVWTVTGTETYDLDDGESLENVLVDQTKPGACLTIRARDRTDWTIRNVGFRGVGREGDGPNRFQLQVSTPAGGTGTVENVWANGKARDGQRASRLGGVYVRASHAGHLDIRHTYIEGFGNNAVYASAVGKDGGRDGSVAIENSYHRDNTASQFRIGSPGSVVRNCVGVVDDPSGRRGPYPGSRGNRNARGVWAKHYGEQRVENCAFYVSPADTNPGGVFEARHIRDRSHGSRAVAELSGCSANPDATTLVSSTERATVHLNDLEAVPTVDVVEGGVPLSPEMAARGKRARPPELPISD